MRDRSGRHFRIGARYDGKDGCFISEGIGVWACTWGTRDPSDGDEYETYCDEVFWSFEYAMEWIEDRIKRTGWSRTDDMADRYDEDGPYPGRPSMEEFLKYKGEWTLADGSAEIEFVRYEWHMVMGEVIPPKHAARLVQAITRMRDSAEWGVEFDERLREASDQ